jgi:hypothetical protein
VIVLIVAWVVLDSLFVAALKYHAFQALNARITRQESQQWPVGSKPTRASPTGQLEPEG